MAALGRSSKSYDWDPMREDYDDMNYDKQYPDDEVNGGVQLDHCKLYIKNIPKALNEDGLRAVLEKYSSNVRVFMSRDPLKRYAIATFETPGEAKLAMMKLNRTEPLKLVISVAHKKNNQDNHNQRQNYPTSQRDYSESVSSRAWSNRKQEELIEDNDLDESIDDADLDLEGDIDADSELEQVNLQLKYLELKAEQIKCKQRIILLNKGGKKPTQRPLSRCILPDGRIVVKNDHERSNSAYGSAGGDTITTNCSRDRAWIEPTTCTAIPTGDKDNFRYTESNSSLPALQQHKCLTCSSPADSYCGRCGVAPYCSQKCQQDDWQRRHRAVCHNLSRGKVGPETAGIIEPEPVEQPPPVPLRQPASVCIQNQRVKEDDRREDNVNNSDRPKRNFHPPGQKTNRNPNFKNYNNLRRPKILNENKSVQDEEESFEIPETKSSQETKPPQATKPSQATKPQTPVNKPQTPVQSQSKSVKESKPMKQELSPSKPVMTTSVKLEAKIPSVVDTTPVKQMIPKNYIVETLKVGDTVFLSATALAADSRAGAGFVCVALHADSAGLYDALCGDYGAECERDGDTHAPQPGALFSYRDPEDEAWYRARRVSPTLAALVDAARVVTSSSGRCARMPAKYAEIPEFCCVLDARGVKIQENLKCTIISKTGDKCKVSIENTSTETVTEGEISRWKPHVEYELDTPETKTPQATKPQTPVQSKPVKQELPPSKPVTTSSVKLEAKVPSVVDTTVKQMVPKNYIVETLKVGDTVFLSATALAADSRAGAGFVCVALHADSAGLYDALCGDYGAECERDGDTHAPQPGALFSYRDPEDEAWYRARRVSPTLAALVDAARVVTSSSGRCARMPAKYAEIPEFCCVLDARGVKIQENLKCTIISKTGDKCKVSIENTSTETVTEGEISRWKPHVEYELDTPETKTPQATKPQTPVQSKPVKQELPPSKPVTTSSVKLEAKVPSVVDTTVKQMVPKNYIVETLKVGDTVFLSATALAADSRAGAGFVCVALHADSAGLYDALCGDYGAECERDGDTHAPQPGALFSYRDPEDEAWYRARRVSPTLAALVDAARVVTFSSSGRCARMPAKYAEIPEFCCVLDARGVKIQESLKCTIISKTGDKCKVSIENTSTETVTEGEISRWMPRVEYGVETPVIPEVERPPIKNSMKVYLVDCTSLDRVILRPSDTESCKEFDAIQEDVLLYAKNKSPLKEPPQKGEMVIAKFTDGLWYRALCRRTNTAQNKYQLEYLEYGNIEISTRENLYPCPASLRPPARPVTSLRARLPSPDAAPALAPPAAEYLNMLRDDMVELVVTLMDGSSSAPSGAEVRLHVVKNNESVNKKIVELSTPEWKKLEEKGVDVIETPRFMINDLTYLELPDTECELEVFVDLEVLKTGSVNARPSQSGLQAKLEELTERMAAYCNSDLGKDPYLPKPEEICIALCPPYPQWFRAVLVEQVGGAGGQFLRLCYLDYGFLDVVPVTSVRKMLPEFMTLPALALHLDIQGFPIDAPNEVLAKAYIFMGCDDNGRGQLRVRNCECTGLGMYKAEAPELLAALKA